MPEKFVFANILIRNKLFLTCSPRPIERRLDWVFYKTEMKIWAVGCGVGWTVLKKVWADYEQLLRVGFSTFWGKKKKKKKIENIVASALKSCIEKR